MENHLVAVLSRWVCLFYFLSESPEMFTEVLMLPSFCAAAAAAKSLQSCPTLCDPRDGSPPGSSIPGILQARTLEWVAISFSNAWKWKVKVKSLSHVRLLATPWTAAYQAPLSMGFSRQEYWSGVPLPSLLKHLSWALIGVKVILQTGPASMKGQSCLRESCPFLPTPRGESTRCHFTEQTV